MLKLKNRTILAVTAHPGDLEWYFGGTICQLSEGNRIIHILAASGGMEHGTQGAGENDGAHRREQFAAAERMGVAETVFFDLPDGDLAYGSAPALRVRLYRAMRNYQPQVVVTFDPGISYPHPDHEAVGRLTIEAARLHPNGRYFPEEKPAAYNRPELVILLDPGLDRVWAVNDIGKTYKRKVEALRCHTSQFTRAWEEIEADLRTMLTAQGAAAGVEMGEVYRPMVWSGGYLVPAEVKPADETPAHPAKQKRGRKKE